MSRDCECVACCVDIAPDSPAYDAGFEPGCKITAVNGFPIRDIIDWRWLSADDEIEVAYIDLDGDSGSVSLERDPSEDWGFVFDGVVFDGIRTCKNACTFCFMRQLPRGLRDSLNLRDDDFRLSFLDGTFSTFTNVDDADIDRIIEQRISPLRVSLHAADHDVRLRLMGKHEARGLEALIELMEAGIEFDAQIVLVPDENDGDVLDRTIEWAYFFPRIKTLGIVPLGFTKYQDVFHKSFDDAEDSLRVLRQLEPYQHRALEERGIPWVYAADEFYCNAYGIDVLKHLPEAEFYGDFSMFEDGIGIVRSAVDAWNEAITSRLTDKLATVLEKTNAHVFYICGESMGNYADQLVVASALKDRFEFVCVSNDFFGGNVNVTGLLCGCDVANAADGIAASCLFDADKGSSDTPEYTQNNIIAIPDVVFNDDALMLDDWTLDDIKEHIGEETGMHLIVVSSNPLNYIQEIAEFASSI